MSVYVPIQSILQISANSSTIVPGRSIPHTASSAQNVRLVVALSETACSLCQKFVRCGVDVIIAWYILILNQELRDECQRDFQQCDQRIQEEINVPGCRDVVELSLRSFLLSCASIFEKSKCASPGGFSVKLTDHMDHSDMSCDHDQQLFLIISRDSEVYFSNFDLLEIQHGSEATEMGLIEGDLCHCDSHSKNSCTIICSGDSSNVLQLDQPAINVEDLTKQT